MADKYDSIVLGSVSEATMLFAKGSFKLVLLDDNNRSRAVGEVAF